MEKKDTRIKIFDPIAGAAKNFIDTQITPRVFEGNRIKVLDPVKNYFTQSTAVSPVQSVPNKSPQFFQDLSGMFNRQPQQAQVTPRATATPTPTRIPSPSPTQSAQPQGVAMQLLMRMRGASPTPSPTATPMPTATPTPAPMRGGLTAQDYEEIIRMGLQNWGGNQLPVNALTQQMSQLPFQHSIYEQYPYLIPAISILETGGGQKMKYENNPFNWGIYVKDFQPKSMEETFGKVSTGLAGRMPQYKEFAETGDLSKFGNVYAPSSDNPGTGGNDYNQNLMKVFDIFRKAEEQVRSKKKAK